MQAGPFLGLLGANSPKNAQISAFYWAYLYGSPPKQGQPLQKLLRTARHTEIKNSRPVNNHCLPMTEVTYNVLEPSLMSEYERHQEVAQILAHGIVRLCSQTANEMERKSHFQLAMPSNKSVHTVPKDALLRAAKQLRNRNAKTKANANDENK